MYKRKKFFVFFFFWLCNKKYRQTKWKCYLYKINIQNVLMFSVDRQNQKASFNNKLFLFYFVLFYLFFYICMSHFPRPLLILENCIRNVGKKNIKRIRFTLYSKVKTFPTFTIKQDHLFLAKITASIQIPVEWNFEQKSEKKLKWNVTGIYANIKKRNYSKNETRNCSIPSIWIISQYLVSCFILIFIGLETYCVYKFLLRKNRNFANTFANVFQINCKALLKPSILADLVRLSLFAKANIQVYTSQSIWTIVPGEQLKLFMRSLFFVYSFF